ncbi:flagellin [Comamonas thiooxydans]|uniref:flagellin n=1 Tax=Comamonas thiooxydans TaxID=363952 RepID=UPI0007C4DCCF|nr:flagellin [Comamonas thiooxydans]OAD82226.1 flagellin [Comamonas thiooxydans]
MAMTINTNIQSLNAQRNLGTSQSSLSTSMQRLSSGMRINSAKDDAAGLAIAERMSAQVRGLNQAQRNANDGVSLAQTAEGALGTIGGNLQRIRELAVQSRNATNSSEDRAALQKEVVQLKSEIDRVAKDTSFNGTKLLDGSFTAQAFQVGANQGQTISIDGIVNANSAALGDWESVSVPATVTGKALTGAQTAMTADDLKINGVDVSVTAAAASGAERLQQLADKINSTTWTAPEDKVTATIVNGKLSLENKLGDIAIEVAASPSGGTGGLAAFDTETGTAAAAETAGLTFKAFAAGKEELGFDKIDISSVEGADNAILAMDAALKSVNSARADLGAIQNRFESVVSNLSVNSENLSASKSRIMDADFAAETANLSRSQILQQAGTAMVAQANQLPQGVLSLLR